MTIEHVSIAASLIASICLANHTPVKPPEADFVFYFYSFQMVVNGICFFFARSAKALFSEPPGDQDEPQ